MTDGLTTLIQKGHLQVFKRMAEDQRLQDNNVFNYAREVHKTMPSVHGTGRTKLSSRKEKDLTTKLKTPSNKMWTWNHMNYKSK